MTSTNPVVLKTYLWSSSRDSNLETQAGWLRMARPMWLLDRLLSRLRTSCRASVPAASLPLDSVARSRWLVSNVDTWQARPECSKSLLWEPERKQKHLHIYYDICFLFTIRNFTYYMSGFLDIFYHIIISSQFVSKFHFKYLFITT